MQISGQSVVCSITSDTPDTTHMKDNKVTHMTAKFSFYILEGSDSNPDKVTADFYWSLFFCPSM
jgi:hypothetical protein